MRVLAGFPMLAALIGSALAQGDKPAQAGPEGMVKVYEIAATPGPEHAMLATGAGRWDPGLERRQ